MQVNYLSRLALKAITGILMINFLQKFYSHSVTVNAPIHRYCPTVMDRFAPDTCIDLLRNVQIS